MAIYLFKSNNEVFLLYDDGTETVVNFIQDIHLHEGIFGVEK